MEEGDIITEEDLVAVPPSESHFTALFRDTDKRQAWDQFVDLPDHKQDAVLSSSAPATPVHRQPSMTSANCHERYVCMNRAARGILRQSHQCRVIAVDMEASLMERLSSAHDVVAFCFEQRCANLVCC